MDNAQLYDNLKYFDLNDEDFIDETFPPTISSLTTNQNEFKLAKEITWRKISDIYLAPG
jgi:hypothetical protein